MATRTRQGAAGHRRMGGHGRLSGGNAGRRRAGAEADRGRRRTAARRAVEDRLGVGVDAVVELSNAIREQGVDAPDAADSKVAIERERTQVLDEDGLPASYDRAAIQSFWDSRPGELQKRWSTFLRQSVPFLTRVAGLLVAGGGDELKRNAGGLAKQARESMESLGPTYIKAGQMLSVRPDVLPANAMEELSKLQDGVPQFESAVAFATIERELGASIDDIFEEISPEPIAAASLAQVYKARLRPAFDGSEGAARTVAVKVQRPAVKALVSKDLYVLRRAAEIYQGLMDRYIAPNQRTDYVALFNEWAVGFYTELDFLNEMKNQQRMRALFEERGLLGGDNGVYVPAVYDHLCTSRVLVSEFVDGRKLSECDPPEIKALTKVGQEVFLTQLLDFGFVHGDPHPGNLLALDPVQSDGKPAPARLALLDFGLMTELTPQDQDAIVNAIVHTANRSYGQLVDDFIQLQILPSNTDRATVQPLMDKAITPYVRGGGAQNYKDEIEKIYGTGASGFQALTGDVVTVMADVPFSIPPYFALLARAVVTLEGTALQGNPNYQLVMEAYPYVARRLLSGDRPALQTALEDILYARGTDETGGEQMRLSRLSTILISAIAPEELAKGDAGAFIDLDAGGEDAQLELKQIVRLLSSPEGRNLRTVLAPEVASALDVLLRRGVRRLAQAAQTRTTLPSAPVPFLPWPAPGLVNDVLGALPVPVPVPRPDGEVEFVVRRGAEVVDTLAPDLSNEELAYAAVMGEVVGGAFGNKAWLEGDGLPPPSVVLKLLKVAAQTRAAELGGAESALAAAEGALATAERAAEGVVGSDAVPWTATGAGIDGDVEDDIRTALVELNAEEREEFYGFLGTVGDMVWKLSARRAEDAQLVLAQPRLAA